MKTFFVAASLLFLFCVVSPAPILAQETSKPASVQTDAQLLRDILLELKMLRSTIAKTNVNQVRFQTTFDQYRSQQGRVDSMNREIESIKNQLAATNPYRANNENMVKTSEERLQQTTDPRQRQSLERQIQSLKLSMETQDQRDKEMKERQTNLELQMPTEQGKLEVLNAELERIKQDINSLLNQ